MDKLFLTILNMSLTGAFVIAAICVARLPLKKAPKEISYCLWTVAGFRLLCPVSIESVFSLIPFKAQTIPQDIAIQTIPRIDSGIPFVNNAVSSVLPTATPAASVNPLQVWTAIGTWVWMIGVVVMLGYGVVSFVILKKKMRNADHIEANIYEAKNIKSPFVLGVFKPIIYLPVGLSEQEKSYIILHEQIHIRRHDHIIKLAAYFVLCLHWFNPLVWAAFLLMGVDMEMSCDERVLEEMGGDTKKAYSLSLLSLATERRFVGGSPLAFGEGGVKERVKNILNFQKPSRLIIILAVLLVTVLSVGFAINRLTPSHDPQDFSFGTYVLENMTEQQQFERMTSFTLRSDGTATFTMALISSYIPPACTYAIEDGEMVFRAIIENEHARNFFGLDDNAVVARFLVEDKSTLVFQSATVLLLADVGARYVPAPIDNNLDALADMRTPYVGNNSAVGKIIDALPGLDKEHRQKYFSIGDDYGTGRAPFTLTIYYEPSNAKISDIRNITVTPENSALLFALIDNLEEVSYAFRSTPSEGELDKASYTSHVMYSREDITEYLSTIGLGWENFKNDWNGQVEKLFAAQSISAYAPHEWLNYFNNDKLPWDSSFDLELPEYPDTIFRWTPEKVTAIALDGEKELFAGMPIWNVYLADLTGDGLPELCATISIGSGIVDNHVVAYDYATQKPYVLSDRMKYDYALSLENKRLIVTKTEYGTGAGMVAGDLAIANGELIIADTAKMVLNKPPEKAPRLEITFIEEGLSEQRIQAVQLATSWNVVDENGDGQGYESDSAHALQLRDYKDFTLNMNKTNGDILLQFTDNYPPQSVSIQRWDAEYATGSQDIANVLDKGKPVEANGNIINISNNGRGYVYEVYAKWEQGSSWYAFRIDAK